MAKATRTPRSGPSQALAPTRNDLPAKTRAAMVVLLQQLLADASALRMSIKHAHWNVRGPNFQQLHEFYDAVAARTDEWSDDLAERCRTLGGAPMGLARDVANNTRIAGAARSTQAFVPEVADALAAFAAEVRKAIDAADDAQDKGTADLFTSVARDCDKQVWLVESHLAG
jgi:starvation-inducible DNA-binding protein